MNLRRRLAALSLMTLLLPLAGWLLVQEVERFMREGQADSLRAAARAVAATLPAEAAPGDAGVPVDIRPINEFSASPQLDGYADEWPTEAIAPMPGGNGVRWAAGRRGNRLYLWLDVDDSSPVRDAPGADSADQLRLVLTTPNGLVSYRVAAAAPGRFVVPGQGPAAGQLEGWWEDRAGGYRVELAWAPLPDRVRLAVGVTDAQPGGAPSQRGMLRNGRPSSWLELVRPSAGVERLLERAVVDPATRAWVVDQQGWVWSASGAPPGEAPSESRWAQRWLYRLLAGRAIHEGQPRPVNAWRLDDALVERALDGEEADAWVREPDTARVFHAVAVPVHEGDGVRRALLLESATEGLLLTTNRALGRVLLTTLAAMLLLAGGLWWFATRLSRRVQRLSAAVSDAMDERGRTRALPLIGDADELGELARNNARLLRAVNEYTAYLEKLAGRLSHELQTPLAITRSSLDNLQDLPPEAERYLARAREGLDRQAAIVRAMSEASRLEAAVAGADWVAVDLAALLATAAEGYRAAYPGREITFTGGDSCTLTCAPDLVAQALDKLVHNAVTCSGSGDTVTLALEADDEICTVHVRNTGSRLPDVMTEQLFDSLVTLRERPGDGTHLGLGLHIVRLVMDAHGGSASARNLPDEKGVEFSLAFPRDGGPGNTLASG